MPGRDGGSSGNYKCPNQITNCAALCQDQVSVNTCQSNNGGEDSPFRSITYCFECTCADGSTPDLASYYNTIPYYVCEQTLENCQYAYIQYGQLAPEGKCPTCGSQSAVKPTWIDSTPTPWSTTSAAAAAVTSNAEAGVSTSSSSSEAVTDSTTWLLTSFSTSTSISETGPTSSSTSSEVLSSPTTAVQLSTTVHTSTTTSATTRLKTSSSTSAAPVKSAGAAMVEPARAVFGMGLAAIMAL
ncbi:hypothetical protein BR93DRAFT_922982 [Coniochaeta sp. PMI_546]|nr:hypothetical protein BR93DRAFT_922982 [Coniochaeta sp. PMI_546]